MRKAWPGASTSSAYLSRGSTCTRGGPRPLPQSGLGGFESAGVDKKRSAATHGRREAQHHPKRAWEDTPGWTWSQWSPQMGPGGRPRMDVVMVVTQGRAQEGTVDGRGHDGHLGRDPAGRPQMDVVMVVTQERAR